MLARPFVGALRARVHQLESQLALLNDCSIVSSTDASGRITDVTERYCHISGYTREELIGRNHNVINSGHHPRKFFMDMYRSLA
ncbi:MAG: PAS domain S-box protein, partial [Pseudomonadota bacterium]|nr:PAS domain S-box protein [Pseudomonadota bacterium]